MIRGKTREEALQMSAEDLSRPLGPLPPMKIHCGQMVEGALRAALEAEGGTPHPAVVPSQGNSVAMGPTLVDSLTAADKKVGKIKIVLNS